METKKMFTRKVAKEVAQKQFNWVIGCVIGTDDPDFTLTTPAEDMEQFFEDELKDMNINPTNNRIDIIKEYYERLRASAIEKLNLMCK